MSTSPRAHRACRDVRVVVIDDEAAFRMALAETLRDDGHLVREESNPLDVGSMDGVDVLLTDYEMPGMNGIELADRVHASHPNVVIVLVTAYWTGDLESALVVRPFLDLQRKPVDYDALHARIHERLGSVGR